MGNGNLSAAIAAGAEPVAVCDVYQPNLEKGIALAAKAGKQVKAVRDFREIIADRSIDTVCISTPDHWHAYMMVEACKAKKDVYVEKPVATTVEETNRMVEAARKYSRVVQVGTARRSWEHMQEEPLFLARPRSLFQTAASANRCVLYPSRAADPLGSAIQESTQRARTIHETV